MRSNDFSMVIGMSVPTALLIVSGVAAPALSTESDQPIDQLADEQQVDHLLDPDSEEAKQGDLVEIRGINPGWRNPWVAETAPNRFGQTGLLRVNSARVGKHGYFDIAIHGRYFTSSDFVLPGKDSQTFADANFSFGGTLFDLVELGVNTRTASSENDRDDPEVRFATGSVGVSAKIGATRGLLAFGIDFHLNVPSDPGSVGMAFDGASLASIGLLTLDLYEADVAPFRMHFNAGYVAQAKSAAFAGQAPEYKLLQLTIDVWSYDQLVLGLGAEYLLPIVAPFVELWWQRALNVPATATVGGAAYGFGDASAVLALGLRLSIGRGLHLDAAVDLGLMGTRAVLGQPVMAKWAAQVGLSYTFSPFVAETLVEVRDKAPAAGWITGCVLDAETGRGIRESYVEFVDTDNPRIVPGDDGCFRSPLLPAGRRSVVVRHPEYEETTVDVVVEDGKDVATSIRLRPSPRLGLLIGTVTSARDEPIEAQFAITDDDGGTHEGNTTDSSFRIQLPPGTYQIVVSSPGYLKVGRRITIEPHGRHAYDVMLQPEPKKRISRIEQGRIDVSVKIPFEHDKARLLKAASFSLDDVVDRILAHPELTELRIEGHTDNTGTQHYNQGLSEARAAAVMDYLISHGVDSRRLSAIGFGDRKPISRNSNERGRAINRRVEFVIVEQQEENQSQ